MDNQETIDAKENNNEALSGRDLEQVSGGLDSFSFGASNPADLADANDK